MGQTGLEMQSELHKVTQVSVVELGAEPGFLSRSSVTLSI